MTVGYIARALALGYSGNAPIPPYPGEQPNAYAYRMVSSESKPRVAGGPPILYNNAPLELYQDCGGPGRYRKREGSCPLTQIDLPTGSAALPETVSAAIVAGNGDHFGGNVDGTSPTLTAAIGDILGEIAAGVAAGHESSTLTLPPSTTAALCSHAADPQNTCTAIADGPGWCMCGDSPNSYPVQTSTDPVCGWTTLPPTTSFDCPAATITSAPDIIPATTNPTPSTTTTTPPNAGIAIWLQQYSSSSGAEVGTWFAYSYTPGDSKLGDPCNSNHCGMTPVPDETPVSDEMRIYPDRNMTISAYHLNLRYELSIISVIGGLWVVEAGGLGRFLTSCSAVVNAKGQACGSQYELTPRLTCEWVN